jgi:hypothetical protein
MVSFRYIIANTLYKGNNYNDDDNNNNNNLRKILVEKSFLEVERRTGTTDRAVRAADLF